MRLPKQGLHQAAELDRLTFDYLLGAGVVHLLLDCVGGQHSVKHVGLALQGGNKTGNIQLNKYATIINITVSSCNDRLKKAFT